MKLTYEVNKDGIKSYTNARGQLHRTDGPAREFANGSKFWFRNGELHRTDGPACEYADGDKYWYCNGNPHRTDGPASEYADGSKYWFLNGEPLTEAQFNERTNPVVKPSCKPLRLMGLHTN